MKISKERLRQIILEEIQGLFEWPNFKGGGSPSEEGGEDEGVEEFEAGAEAGEDLYNMVKHKLAQLLADMDKAAYETTEGDGDHPGKSCEEAHADCEHEAYIAGQC